MGKLPQMPASFVQYTITATPDTGAPIKIVNVTWGEVWLCSGQSNMGYTIAIDSNCFNNTRNADGSPNCSKEIYGTCGGRACVWNAGLEVADMKKWPHIRLMDVQRPGSTNNKPFFAPIPQAASRGWHRPDQYAPTCSRNHSDCRPDASGVSHCGCRNYTAALGCCSLDGSGIWRQDEQTFSAACWFFARDLYASLDPPRPVGVMNNAVGGTADQLWSPPEALDSCKNLGKPWEWPKNYTSSELWNSLVVPLSRHVIKGVVWYQGEANSAVNLLVQQGGNWCRQCLKNAFNCSAADRAQCEVPANPVADGRTYLCSFPAMVKSWRQLWMQNSGSSIEPAFGWVQLNSYGSPDGPRGHSGMPGGQPLRNGSEDPLGAWSAGFPSIRWAQTQSLKAIANSFQAVVLDTPSPSGAIHSCFKQQVGSRLARGALATAYGRSDLQLNSFVSSARQVGQRLVVTVANTGGSLLLRASLRFEVLLINDNRWHSAPILRTEETDTLTLSLPNVTVGADVVAVRYLWSNTPCSASILSCPVYVTVPKLGSLTGEKDTLPLGPAILPVTTELEEDLFFS